MNEPTKPGHWYGKIDGEETIILVDEIMVCQSYCGMMFNPSSSCVEWYNEPVPTLVETRELHQQVEFLEWLFWHQALGDDTANLYETSDGHTNLTKVGRNEIVRWSGQLRDGWKHWDKIKEAIK